MIYEPITEEKKQQWIDWLDVQKANLDSMSEVKGENIIFGTPEGDVATAKDLVGNLLALLKNESITIN